MAAFEPVLRKLKTSVSVGGGSVMRKGNQPLSRLPRCPWFGWDTAFALIFF